MQHTFTRTALCVSNTIVIDKIEDILHTFVALGKMSV